MTDTKRKASLGLFLIGLGFASLNATAQSFEMPDISVLGGREEFTEPGSVQVLSAEQLKERPSQDPHELLSQVSGLYVREEDGYGLRPNIGLRGAHSNRSSKISLMEDGVLVSPAPYSAPAAYYFPMMSKVNSIEVFKGPSTLKYGPNSIGGAINMITRPFSQEASSEISLKYGQFNTVQIGGYTQKSWERLQVLVEAHRWQSDGFKELPDDGFTGFYRDDVLFKARYDVFGNQQHVLDLKVNWADEKSYETYLGTTAADFADNPFQRYAASSNDQYDHVYWSKELRLFSQWSDNVSTQATLYRHDFTRSWAKFDRFADSAIDVQNVLLNPEGGNAAYYEVLTGQRDSTSAEILRYGINARDYYTQGLNLEMDIVAFENDDHSLTFDTGTLLHQDEIDRNHTARNYNMVDGRPEFTGSEFLDTANQEIDRSDVFRGYLVGEYKKNRFTARLGSRYESVASRRNDKLTTNRVLRQDDIWIPGGGLSYQVTDDQILFFGLHKGITLPGPGEVGQVQPEEALNYEIGYRLQRPLYVEVVG
ncbi:MAG: TonB-dependent receptor plug domain-containing protein, partial [Bdellovibrionales bacterium]|nr:TonB-dependent receptor plug domain-containing protein [Bdellovibrionales bacterium]